MRHGIWAVCWGLVVVLWCHVPGVAQLPTVPWDVHADTLDNGLKVLLLRDERAPVVTLMVWYRVGARNEQLGSTGLAHLLEHLMFKGTTNYGPKTFSHLIQRHGGRHNAFTSEDYTAYFERIATDNVDVAIKLEADRMQNLLVDAKEFQLERQVVQEERRRRLEDQPIAFLWENVQAAAYQAHPFGSFPLNLTSNRELASIFTTIELFHLGLDYLARYPDLIRAVTPDDVQRVARQYVHPDRGALVILADLKRADVQD